MVACQWICFSVAYQFVYGPFVLYRDQVWLADGCYELGLVCVWFVIGFKVLGNACIREVVLSWLGCSFGVRDKSIISEWDFDRMCTSCI